jgi:uncharacterized protein YoxC
MESTQLYTRHIQINHQPKRPSRHFAESFAIGFEPDATHAPDFGNLYLLFEYSPDNTRINFDKIVEGCGKAFFESGPQTELESRFKMCLRNLNEIINSSKGSCNIGLVAIAGNSMLFSSVGDITMVHARKQSATSLTSSDKSELFKEIGQGKIHLNDRVIMASKAIATNYSQKELAHIVTSQSLSKAEEQILMQFETNKDIPYSGLLIEAVDMPTQIDEAPPKDNSRPPISTAKFNSLMKEISKSIKEGGKKAKTSIGKTAAKTKTDLAPKAGSKIKRGWTNFWSKYINPNPKKAIIAVIITAFIILSVVLGTSLFSGGSGVTKNLDTASSLLDSAQSSLAKNNQASAQESLDKANEFLSKITPKEQEQLNQLAQNKKIKQSYASIKQKALEISDKITGTTRITLTNSFNIPQSNLNSLVWANNTLYALDNKKGSILEINPLLGQPIERANNADLVGAKTASSLADAGLAIIGANNLWQYLSDSGLQQLKTPSKPDAVDIASYLNNIYLLSPSENQVIRYAKSGTTLGSRANLLKNLPSGELSGATSLEVKANIFIAKGKEIILFEQGSERSYRINNLPSSFGNIKSLYYNADAGYFIISNDKSNRLALLNADADSASFSKLYALPNDEIISSFTVEPKNSQILLNSGNKIITYKIEK